MPYYINTDNVKPCLSNGNIFSMQCMFPQLAIGLHIPLEDLIGSTTEVVHTSLTMLLTARQWFIAVSLKQKSRYGQNLCVTIFVK